MEISFTGRHCTIPDETKAEIRARMEAFFASIPMKLISTKIIIDLEDHTRIKTEIVLNAKEQTFEAHNESYRTANSINEALDKLETQVRRYIDRKQTHHA